MSVSLGCGIRARSEYKTGEPLAVSGWLKNNGDAPVWVRKWDTFLEPICSDFVRITHDNDNSVLPYDGIIVYRAPAGSSSYIRIAPGEMVSGDVDLSEAYSIEETGEYHVSFELLIGGVFEERLQPNGEAPPRFRVELSSGVTSFRLLEGQAHRPTIGARLRTEFGGSQADDTLPEPGPSLAPNQLPPDPRAPSFKGFDEDQQDQLHAAHYSGYATIRAAYYALVATPWSPSTNSEYADWFGTQDPARIKSVTSTFLEIGERMARTSVRYVANERPDLCPGNRLAYIIAGLRDIFICPYYFSWLTWTPEQTMIVPHELSHLFGCRDYAYGEGDCYDLAESSPNEAIQNADSIAYFAYNAEGEAPENNGVWTEQPTPLSDATTARPSVASFPAGAAMLMYQDNNTPVPWLWFHSCTLPSTSGTSGTIKNTQTNNPCMTAYGPAVAALNLTFYCVYIDGDPKSANFGQLVYLSTPDNGTSWVQPQPVLSGLVTTLSPAAVATPDGRICCVYINSNQQLMVLFGTPGANGSLTWSQPAAIGSTPLLSVVEPGLGIFNGLIYCSYGLADTFLRFASSADGTTWSAPTVLPLSNVSGGAALIRWNIGDPGAGVLMCLYRGAGSDEYLRYVTFDGKTWSPELVETSNYTAAGPALACYATTLYAFYRGGGSNVNIHWATAPVPEV